SENCAAIGENLFESELFGYEKGAFTGADETKPGLFEVADGGTLFLDEIGDLNLENQKKILRALQEGEIRRVGGKTPIPVDVRILSATNRNLEQLIKEGAFREDLYYRLKVVTIKLPPLREHVEDIPLLVDYFLKEVALERARATPDKDRPDVPRSLAPETMRAFLSYSWPGNVRELENEVHRLVIMGERDFRPGATTSVRRYQGTGFAIPPGLGMEEALALFERDLILGALEEAGWNKSAAAKALKIGRMKLHRKMERLGLDRQEAK
ncbi:MAG: sigma-54-dependent Fis family transcriptional regulator, partial [Planctomycetes bacterium]|nr:sigma-54-dependent Fis family transcriptional regulator [Planctomycetota bacterium]